jgi:hypothetical protein
VGFLRLRLVRMWRTRDKRRVPPLRIPFPAETECFGRDDMCSLRSRAGGPSSQVFPSGSKAMGVPLLRLLQGRVLCCTYDEISRN